MSVFQTVLSASTAIIRGGGAICDYRILRTYLMGHSYQEMLYIVMLCLNTFTYVGVSFRVAGSKIMPNTTYLAMGIITAGVCLYSLACRVSRFQKHNAYLKNWYSEYQDHTTKNKDYQASLGEFVLTYKRNYHEIYQFKEDLALKEHAELVQRIDSMYQQSKYVKLKESLCSVFNFLYLHIPDWHLIALISASLYAIIHGNRMQMITLALSLVSWLEQGLFWMQPVEKAGPFFTWFQGKILRVYNPVIKIFLLLVFPMFNFLYKGIIGKLVASMFLSLIHI